MSPEIKMAWLMGVRLECFIRGEWRPVMVSQQYFELHGHHNIDPENEYLYRLAPLEGSSAFPIQGGGET